ncbi:MAG: two-component sensor histidine kinase [Oscillospiraceae bacterium]|jgi:signal transduction histidine kinase|nr:two-component sensor histidine kinase [Oscillospiraceae bacterium]
MIRTLRRKYMLVTMLLAFVLLAFVFGALFFGSLYRAREETRLAMVGALDARNDRKSAHRIGERVGQEQQLSQISRIPVFTVAVYRDGTTALLWVQNVDTTAEGFIESLPELAQAALSAESPLQEESFGILEEYNLSYIREVGAPPEIRLGNIPDSTDAPNWGAYVARIAFADMSVERRSIRSMAWICALSFAGAMVGFFIISLFLARWMVRPVERAWLTQQRFLADASHELKTPLTVLLANIGILMSSPAETIERQWKWVENSEAEARKMRRLVDQMLFLAKSEDTRESMAFAPVNLSDLATGVCLTFESVAFEREIVIDSLGIAPNLIVHGDGESLERMIVVLLDNAVKYSPERETVIVTLAARAGAATLAVRNGGEPLSAETRAHLFERFYRADSARGGEGYGLGLAIAQSIAQAHKGNIRAESDARGAAFIVTLPLWSIKRGA